MTGSPARRRRPRLLTPGTLIVLALIFGGFYVLLHLLGLREDVSVLTGTTAYADDPAGREAAAGNAVLYLISYLLATLVAPILVLAACIWALLGAVLARTVWRERNKASADAPAPDGA